MLVIVSDIHLTDGTTGETVGSRAFERFYKQVCEMTISAGWRNKNKYIPIEQIDVLLLGDILDVIRSEQWLSSGARPWHSDRVMLKQVETITDAILAENADSLFWLKKLKSGIEVPNELNDSVDAISKTIVPVNIWYMTGNHDWFFSLSQNEMTAVRKKVCAALGLSNKAERPFPWKSEEEPQLHNCLQQHKAVAFHGDCFDAYNYTGNRKESSLGDAVVIDLITRYPYRIKRNNALRNSLTDECLNGLKELDNVKPAYSLRLWLKQHLDKTCADSKLRDKLMELWDETAGHLFEIEFVEQKDKWGFDAYDKMKAAFTWKAAEWLPDAIKDQLMSNASYAYNAFHTNAILDSTANYVIMGHTHDFEVLPLRSIRNPQTEVVTQQYYFNTGTWRTVHKRATVEATDVKLNVEDWKRLMKNSSSFASYETMTILTLYKDDERRGKPFEMWTGYLSI